jgi:hypothetical protein
MNFVRTLFGLRQLYFKQTAIHIAIVYTFIGCFLLVASTSWDGTLRRTILDVASVVVVYAFIRTSLRTILANSYTEGYGDAMVVLPSQEVMSGVINLELDDIDHLKPIATYGDVKVFLATANFYRRTKLGPYLARQAYYMICEAPLERALPHIIFDSKSAKESQFKTFYLQAQRVSVQGAFDDVFTTYAPQTYNIDTLSFITPEVMEALVAARMYDIEILNKTLLLYGPLLDKTQIESFARQGSSVAHHINDNIDTYRDDRLAGQQRLTEVTPFARSLLRNPRKSLIIASLSGAATVALVVWAFIEPQFAQDILLNLFSLVIYGHLITSCFQAYKIISDNKRAERAFTYGYGPTTRKLHKV